MDPREEKEKSLKAAAAKEKAEAKEKKKAAKEAAREAKAALANPTTVNRSWVPALNLRV